MRRGIVLSIQESSSLEAYLALKEQTQQTGDYQELDDKEEELVNSTEEQNNESTSSEDSNQSQDDTSDDSDQTQEGSSDDTSDTDPDQTNSESEQTSEETLTDVPENASLEDKADTVIAESLRSEHYDRLVLENYEAVSDLTKGAFTVAGQVATTAFGLMKDVALYLTEIGVKYSPAVVAAVKKTVFYLFLRAVKSLLKAHKAAIEISKRSKTKMLSAQGQLTEYKERVQKLKAMNVKMKQESLQDRKLVSWMTASQNIDAHKAAQSIRVFQDNVISTLDNAYQADLQAVSSMLEMFKKGRMFDPVSALKVNNLQLDRMVSVQSNHELIDKQVSAAILPKQVKLVTELPKNSITSIDDLSKAYQDSRIYLTPDNRIVVQKEELDYLDPGSLESFIDSLGQLVDGNLKHIQRHENIIKDLSKLKLGYRIYFEGLVKAGKDKKVHDTFVEYIYLKQSFANRVYLPASIDVRDYVSDFVAQSLRFIELCMRNYEVDDPQPDQTEE